MNNSIAGETILETPKNVYKTYSFTVLAKQPKTHNKAQKQYEIKRKKTAKSGKPLKYIVTIVYKFYHNLTTK